jgi:hypothetical protein
MLGIAPPESDLYLPLPRDGVQWHPYTLHTHYFGIQIPAAEIGCFIYVRYQPAFPLSQGGIVIAQGTDGHTLLDATFVDYEATMPWPQIDGNRISTANGLVIDFLAPGETVQVRYRSRDGRVELDMIQSAVTPLVTRGHVMPGEELHRGGQIEAGGSEQFMHATGTLKLDGVVHEIDCLPIRDRSWGQVRTDARGEVQTPPIGWTPMCFGPDLAFNQVGYEDIDTDPLWRQLGLYPQISPDARAHHFAWIIVDGELREVSTIRRKVLERHPVQLAATRQEIEATDDHGDSYRFVGEALAMTELYVSPNLEAHDSLYRWESRDGRIAFGPYQEVWHDIYQHAARGHYRAASR